MRFVPLATSLLALLLPTVAAAESSVMLRQRIDVANSAQPPREQTQYYSSSRRITDDDRSTTIIDLDKKTITYVNKRDKTYSVITFADLEQRADSHDDRVRKLPPSMRDTVKADVRVTLAPTGKTETIAGWEAKEYAVDAKGIHGTVWVAENLDLGGRAADWAKVTALFGGRTSPTGHLDEALSKMKGTAVRRSLSVEPLPLATSEVIEVRREAPPSSLTRIPKDYTKIDFPRARAAKQSTTPGR